MYIKKEKCRCITLLKVDFFPDNKDLEIFSCWLYWGLTPL